MPKNVMFSTKVIDENPVHTRIAVFNFGGHAGTLCVNTSDAEELVNRINGEGRGFTSDGFVERLADTVRGPVDPAALNDDRSFAHELGYKHAMDGETHEENPYDPDTEVTKHLAYVEGFVIGRRERTATQY